MGLGHRQVEWLLQQDDGPRTHGGPRGWSRDVGCGTSDAHSSWNLRANLHASGTKLLLFADKQNVCIYYKTVTLVTFVFIFSHLNDSTV